MPVEFLGIAATNDGSETTARTGPIFDKEYTLRLARAHEENGWDRVLFAYGSNSPERTSEPPTSRARPKGCNCCWRIGRTFPTRRSRPRPSPPSTRSAAGG